MAFVVYAVVAMLNLISITDARNNLSRFVKEVSQKGKKYVLVRDSVPEAVVMPYQDYVKQEEEEKELWQFRFDRLIKEARKAFRKWAAGQGIDVKKLTEEEVYELIDRI
ncbi:MAG: hypothetical protein A2784_02770 [Candidatus Chisholmbacteria bacterium RIFCSPHIGHO2_01_FULL_48_12]|uniref:Antitoxin n=1 Tax=Candidatus Chisholmbacteria bacterium RIFCSPHIGHO2_01_FULL_48_12 TaxID=1797589 RepID=A0A1G1VPX2_9BACT|nr:MAG: hypothetical protein A2784_02770 [Candidatus Chisholmbacteria bacterium RIFCSPHIGHO2_01_FULL_48_12]